MGSKRWFEISHDGFRRMSSGRPLARLLLEAVQNGFDEGVTSLDVSLERDRVVVEDDAEQGFGDERAVYTVFLSDKQRDAGARGRMGRGLKELLASMESATVETVGTTVHFGEKGRTTRKNERTRGTRVELRRAFDEDELDAARLYLRLCIPPKGTTLRVDGRAARRPRLAFALSACELETVTIERGVERLVTEPTELRLYVPRRGERPHLFEMGVPIEPMDVPWHIDVGQRVPLGERRDATTERFRLAVKATLLEAMIHRYLDARDLRADWVHEVVARWPLRPSVLDAYVSRAFPRGAVLGSSPSANDRAKQVGAHVIDASTISHGAYVSLSRVLETADDYVKRRSAEFGGEEVEPDVVQSRFSASVRWLARKLTGKVVRVRFFARDPTDDGLLEDAYTEAAERLLSFNVRSTLRFDDVLDPPTLAVVLHELAHLDVAEHDHRYIDRLQSLAGMLARLLADGGHELAETIRNGGASPAP